MKRFSILKLQQQFGDYIKRSSIHSSHEIENIIIDQSPFSIQERLLVYKNAYKQRIHGSLEEDFPKTFEVLKSENFFELVEEYMMKFPSTYWSLAEFSKNLPEFISNSRWGKNYKFLNELAAFEWLKNLSFLAKDSEPFDFTAISKIPENKHKDIFLKLSPSVIFFKSKWAVHCVGIKKFIPKRSYFYIIYRFNGVVYHENMPQNLWQILNKISQGLNIGEIIELSLHLEEQKISKCISKWVSKGIISHFIYNGEYQ